MRLELSNAILFLIERFIISFYLILTRPGVDKVKPKGWFKYSLQSSVGLFHHVLVYMVDLYLVLPALNLSFLDSGILMIVQQ